MRSGIKTTEFWLLLVGGVLATAQQAIFPDTPFPKEAFLTLGLWIIARIGEKTFGSVDTDGKRAWETSEFWVTIVYSIAKYIYPAMPDEMFMAITTWIFGRPAMKVIGDKKITNLFNKG